MERALLIQLDQRWVRQRVVVPKDLDEAAITRRPLVGDDNTI